MADRPLLLAERQILLVEDNFDARELVTFILESAGATVISAESIAAGLSVLEQLKPDLILTDLKLPDGDGCSYLSTWRQRETELGIACIPAIAMSGADRNVSEKRALDAGFQHYISKPFSIKTLVEVAVEVISKHQQAGCLVG
ncbi:response regulator [Oculatella sp. LEGE 06141]|uniref:response regulator n=1 Tax=Oculatella sp. LEGE 06141 TaxID=1828648 RepID=UPI001881789F|nr:response regulator [Oculatella sp. LEGE 06141]MBE9180009.1 response regulator [Oculatella sp. LEGE 06141]